jgi:hypothetical protein
MGGLIRFTGRTPRALSSLDFTMYKFSQDQDATDPAAHREPSRRRSDRRHPTLRGEDRERELQLQDLVQVLHEALQHQRRHAATHADPLVSTDGERRRQVELQPSAPRVMHVLGRRRHDRLHRRRTECTGSLSSTGIGECTLTNCLFEYR